MPDADSYKEDLERYRNEAKAAVLRYGEDHPLTRMWVRRARVARGVIDLLESPRGNEPGRGDSEA